MNKHLAESLKLKFDVNKKGHILLYGLFIILSILICFGSLDKLPIILWDESRLAINAIEMSRSDNWWITTFENQPDLWNTKPPLLIWMQALLIKLMGIHPLAIRIPTALATFITIHSLFFFVKKYVGNTIMAFFAALVLMGTTGYICVHVSRSGDFDALLILFTTLSSFFYFGYLENDKAKYLGLFFLFLALGVLTKSVAALLFLPGLLIYTLYKKKLFNLIKNKYLYLFSLLFVMILAFFYIGREWQSPGYLQAVYNNEIGGRYLSTLEQHQHPFTYYLELISGRNYVYWIGLVIIGIFLGNFQKEKKIKDLSTFCTLLSLSFILIISSAKTKLMWYDAPIYPFFAILTSLPLYGLFQYLFKKIKVINNLPLFLTIFTLVFFSFPIIERFQKEINMKGGHNIESVDNSYLLSKYIRTHYQELDNTIIVADEYIPHVDFYRFMAQEKGITIQRKYKNEIKPRETILVTEEPILRYVEENFISEKLGDYNGIKTYLLLEEKE